MKFKKLGSIATIMLCSNLLAVPLANATGFLIANNTDKNFTVNINQACSVEFGIINAHSTKIISEAAFNNACKGTPLYCEAKIYHSDNCSGEKVANVVFDTTIGVKEITVVGHYTTT